MLAYAQFKAVEPRNADEERELYEMWRAIPWTPDRLTLRKVKWILDRYRALTPRGRIVVDQALYILPSRTPRPR